MLSEALRKISRVQEIDSLILELERRFSTVDPGRAAQGRFEAVKAAREQAEASLKRIRSDLADLELESKQIDQKREKERQRLYSGGVYNAKEAEAIERELLLLKERSSHVDDRILALWDEQEPAKTAVDSAMKQFEEAERALDEYLAKYAQVKAEYEAMRGKLLEGRAEATAGCDEELLERYDFMRGKHGGVGIAAVTESECGICHMTIPKLQLQRITGGETLETCQNCGRYLYSEPDLEL
ncbi:MAG: hypothetical protein IH851_03305 [Armatimonadetes bacterium]|nr:hypothetical protein [Armatimonadota bacterium]